MHLLGKKCVLQEVFFSLTREEKRKKNFRKETEMPPKSSRASTPARQDGSGVGSTLQDTAARIVALREANRPHLELAETAVVGDTISFEWDFTPAGQAIVDNAIRTRWTGIVSAVGARGPTHIHYEAGLPLLMEVNQEWSPQSDEGDIRISGLSVTRRIARGFTQRHATTPQTHPSTQPESTTSSATAARTAAAAPGNSFRIPPGGWFIDS